MHGLPFELDATRVLVAVALAAALLAVVQTVRLWWRGARVGWQLRARAERAAAGEGDAEPLLRAHGYTIVARQVVRRFWVAVDGHRVAVALRADLLVERAGFRFVAEVKTGTVAPSIESAATRRQLLEYLCAFETDGALLVDAEAGLVHEVEFPFFERATSTASSCPRCASRRARSSP